MMTLTYIYKDSKSVLNQHKKNQKKISQALSQLKYCVSKINWIKISSKQKVKLNRRIEIFLFHIN